MTEDSAFQKVREKAAGAARRLRWIRALRTLSLALAVALTVNLILVLLERFELVPPYYEVVLAVAGAGLMTGLVLGLWRGYTLRQGALAIDERLALKERIASAAEFAAEGRHHGIFNLQFADAQAHAETVDLRRTFPHRYTREMRFFSVVAVLFGASFLLPHMPILQSEQERRERADIRREGAKIQLVAKKIEAQAERDKLSQRIAKQLDKLGRSMERGRTPKKEALKKMNEFSQQVKEQQQKLAAAKKAKSFEKALEELKKQEAKMAEPPEAVKKLPAMKASDKLTEAMKNRNLDEAAKALQQLQKALENKEGLSKEALEALAKKMKALAEAFKGTDLDQLAEQLAKLAEMLKKMDIDPQMLQRLMEELQDACMAALDRQLTEAELARMAAILAQCKEGLQLCGLTDEPGGHEWGIGEGAGTPRESPEIGRETMETYKSPGVHGEGPAYTMQFLGAPEEQEATAPYYRAYGEYRKTAESALSKEEIPAAYREQVKKYFDSIGPSGE